MEDLQPIYAQSGAVSINNDEILIIAARHGDSDAFERLYQRYSPRIYRSISKILNNQADREDAMQDCFLKAFRRLDTFQFRSTFSTWLTRIGINSALMILRKLRYRREDQVCTTGELYDLPTEIDFIDPRGDPETRYIQTDLTERLRIAVHNLPPATRAAIEMRNARDASVNDISRTLNLSVPAVKSRLHRARVLLQRRIGENAMLPNLNARF